MQGLNFILSVWTCKDILTCNDCHGGTEFNSLHTHINAGKSRNGCATILLMEKRDCALPQASGPAI